MLKCEQSSFKLFFRIKDQHTQMFVCAEKKDAIDIIAIPAANQNPNDTKETVSMVILIIW